MSGGLSSSKKKKKSTATTSIRIPSSQRSFSQQILSQSQPSFPPPSPLPPPIDYESFSQSQSQPCTLCRSTRWRMNEIGYLVCENGHQNRVFRTEEQDDFSGGTGRRMRQAFSQDQSQPPSQSQRLMELSQIEDGRNPQNIVRNGDEDRFDLALAMQHILKDQIISFCKYLNIDKDESFSFEERAKSIWLSYIDLQEWNYSEGDVVMDSLVDDSLSSMDEKTPPPFGPSILLAIILLSSTKYPVCGEDLRRAVMKGFIRFDTVKLPPYLMSWLKVRRWDIYFKGKSYAVPSVSKIEALSSSLASLIGYSPSRLRIDASLFMDLWSKQLRIPVEISIFVKEYFTDSYCWGSDLNISACGSPIERLMVNFLMGIWICCPSIRAGAFDDTSLKQKDEDFDLIFENDRILFDFKGQKILDYISFCDNTLNLRNRKTESMSILPAFPAAGRLERLEFYYPLEENDCFVDIRPLNADITLSNSCKYSKDFHALLAKMSKMIGRSETSIREALLKTHRRIIRN